MKTIRKVFVLAVIAFLLAGLLRTLLFPKELNYYENRYANQFPAFSLASYGDGSFQDGVEESLADQVYLAQRMKALYNQTQARYIKHTLDTVSGLLGLEENRYVRYGNLQLYGGDFVVNWTRSLSDSQEALDRKIDALNGTFARHPELDFYVYYIEKDTDIHFETGEKSGLGEYLFEGLELPESHRAIFSVDSYQEFSEKFYRTDTHWNCDGSYEGYLQLVSLLGCQGEPLEPAGEKVLVG